MLKWKNKKFGIVDIEPLLLHMEKEMEDEVI